ncbi:MAG: B12-binding domain-containing radical SAM protein [Xanthobacteraceae bacterium]
MSISSPEGRLSDARACNALLICPRFEADTFWNFKRTSEVFGAKYPAPPLGLITLAALLPRVWSIRLVNRNTEELTDEDLDWADLVLTGGMLPQGGDMLDVVDLCHARGKPVVVGGPGVTSSPHLYQTADFQILGEAEGVIDKFVEAWEAGAGEGVFEAEKFQVDVTKTPIPRFDLLKFDDYLHIGVQFSRGCPFTCEFCDIIELYGRVPRAKTNAQMLAELDELYRLGYRGHVDFVDDNLIGNKKAVKAFLPELAKWLEAHDHPFEFTTEASLNLADDAELLALLNRANFVGVFVGIESPDTATLTAMRKKQNTRRNIAQSIHTIYAAGLFVHAGFIIGFDSETQSVADAMVDLIEEAAIPVCMVGLLYALPNTQLTRRLEKEGRLHPHLERGDVKSADQCTMGLNFETLRPRQEILADYVSVLDRIYDPVAYAGRLQRLAAMLDNSGRKQQTRAQHSRRRFSRLQMLHRVISNLPEPRELFRRTLTQCFASNTDSTSRIVLLMALYLDVGQFSRDVTARLETMIAALEPAVELQVRSQRAAVNLTV